MARIREETGWAFDISDDLYEVPEPTGEELNMIRIFDPNRYYLGPMSG